MEQNYAIVENQLVVNVVVADSDFAQEQGWVLLTDNAAIGWSYIDGKFVPPELPKPSPEQITQLIVVETQQRLDDFAKTRNYDGILSLATYATSTNPKFQIEGQYGVTARDETWSVLYSILAAVEGGTRPMPAGYDEIEPELPVLEWPTE